MSATPAVKHCVEWCSGCVEWCSMAASSTLLPYNSYADIPRRGIATANIQQFFDMTKHYGKNLKIFTDLGDFFKETIYLLILNNLLSFWAEIL